MEQILDIIDAVLNWITDNTPVWVEAIVWAIVLVLTLGTIGATFYFTIKFVAWVVLTVAPYKAIIGIGAVAIGSYVFAYRATSNYRKKHTW